jgi:hypothetical protein
VGFNSTLDQKKKLTRGSRTGRRQRDLDVPARMNRDGDGVDA